MKHLKELLLAVCLLLICSSNTLAAEYDQVTSQNDGSSIITFTDVNVQYDQETGLVTVTDVADVQRLILAGYHAGQMKFAYLEDSHGNTVQWILSPEERSLELRLFCLDEDYSPVVVIRKPEFSTYTVIFETNGGTMTSSTNVVVQSGDSVEKPSEPAKNGYSFAGWYADASFSEPVEFPVRVTDNTTVYAKWTPMEFTVFFYANGGTVSPITSKVAYGEAYGSLPVPLREGYRFDGWELEQAIINAETIVTSLSDHILVAQWSLIPEFEVTFELNGGSANWETCTQVLSGNIVEQPETPSKTGHSFGGWYTDAACTKAATFPYAVTADSTFYAKWNANRYTVTFDAGEGTVASASKEVVYGSVYGTLPVPERDGYLFDGWVLENTFVTAETYVTKVESHILTAQWSLIPECIVTFELNGGSAHWETCVQVKSGSSVDEPETPSKDEYVFDGWYTNVECTKKATFPYTVTADTTIYAKWSAMCTVTFELNGGTMSGESVVYVKAGDLVTKPEDPVRKAYRFGGWFTNAGCSDPASFPLTISKDSTIYAKWVFADDMEQPDVSLIQADDSITVIWSKDEKAEYYEIYYAKVSDAYTLAGTVSSKEYGSFEIKGLEKDESYRVYVEACRQVEGLSWIDRKRSNYEGIHLFDEQDFTCSLEQKGENQVVLNWTKPVKDSVTGTYYIYMSENVEELGALVASTSKNTAVVTIDNAAIGKTYYFKIRAMLSSVDGIGAGYNLAESMGAFTIQIPIAPGAEYFTYQIVDGKCIITDCVSEYDVYELVNGEFVVTGTKKLENVVVPSHIEGYPVTEIAGPWSNRNIKSVVLPDTVWRIGENAFGSWGLQEISIPDSVTEIGDYAFEGCDFRSITLPQNLKRIGIGVFRFCTQLKDIYIPDSVTEIGEAAFWECGFESIVLPQKLEYIGNFAFDGCNELKEIHIPDSVKEIGVSAFGECKSLVTVTLPKGLACISDEMFYNCTSLKEITLPDTLTEIGASAFYGCKIEPLYLPDALNRIGPQAFGRRMGEIVVGENASTYTVVDGAIYTKDKKELVYYPYSNKAKEYAAPDTLEKIADYVFYNNRIIERVVLSKNTMVLGASSFEGCAKLKEIDLSKAIEAIGKKCFSGCSALRTVVFSKNLSTIDEYAFQNCTYITKVELPDRLGFLGMRAFAGCTALTSADLPKTMETISSGVFEGCTSLQNVVFPDELESIGASAFRNTALVNLMVPESVISISDYAFYNCLALKTVVIPDTVQCVGENAFSVCTKLQSITLPKVMETIGSKAFAGCVSLQKVVLPETVGTIGSYLFSGCTSLSEVSIPQTMGSFESGMFSGCSALTSVSLPRSINRIAVDMFRGCTSLKEITLHEGIMSIEGYAFKGCTALETIVLQKSVTRIGSEAFKGCTNLRDVTFSEDLTCVGEGAFMDCAALETVLLHEQVKELGRDAFRNCTSLQKVTLPRTMERIGICTFYGCTQLKELNMPDRMTNAEGIGSSFVSGCSSLDEVIIPEGIEDISFVQCAGPKRIVLPDSYTHIKESAFRYCEAEFIQLSDFVTRIAPAAFEYCTNLKEIVLPKSMSYMGPGAFRGCTALTRVEYHHDPKFTMHLYEETFADCVNLESMNIPEGVKYFEDDVFLNCDKLTLSVVGSSAAHQYAIENNIPCVFDFAIAEISADCDSCTTETPITWTASVGGTTDTEILYQYSVYQQNNTWMLLQTSDWQQSPVFTWAPTEAGHYRVSVMAKDSSGNLTANVYSDTVVVKSEFILHSVTPESATCPAGTTMKWTVNASGDGELRYYFTLRNKDKWVASAIYSGKNYYIYTLEEPGIYYLEVEVENSIGIRKSRNSVPVEAGIDLYSYELLEDESAMLTRYNGESLSGTVTVPSEVHGYPVRAIGGLYYGQESLEQLIIPEGITKISGRLAQNCTSLKEVSLPESLVCMEDSVFEGCTSLEQVSLPGQLETLGASVFAKCTALSDVEIPITVKVIGTSAFSGCKALTSIQIPANVKELGHSAFSGCSALQEIALPSGLEKIGVGTFTSCSALEEISLPDTVLSVGERAFINCSSLENIRLSENLPALGEKTFFNCTSLQSIVVPENIRSLGVSVFEGCCDLTEIRLPATMDDIGEKCFFNCTSLKKVIIPDGIGCLMPNLFRGCTALTEVTIPESVKEIRQSVFYGCASLTQVALPQELEKIGERVFAECTELKQVVIPDKTVDVEAGNLFQNCVSLETVVLGTGIDHLDSFLFDGCISLMDVQFRGTIRSIENGVFRNCSSLKVLQVNGELDTAFNWMDDQCFSGCINLEKLMINCPNDNRLYVAESAFNNCPKLTLYVLEGTNMHRIAEKRGLAYQIIAENDGDPTRTVVNQMTAMMEPDM